MIFSSIHFFLSHTKKKKNNFTVKADVDLLRNEFFRITELIDPIDGKLFNEVSNEKRYFQLFVQFSIKDKTGEEYKIYSKPSRNV